MFNLLVHGRGWQGNRGVMPRERLFEHTAEEIRERFSDDIGAALQQLKKFLCLFMEEGTGRSSHARVGRIKKASLSAREIVIEYDFVADVLPISNEIIFDNKEKFGLSSQCEFHRTHWSVRDVNIFEALYHVEKSRRLNPKVFRIPDETIDPNVVSVMMPFNAEFDKVYATIKKAVESVGLSCIRVDEMWENPQIIEDIVSLINISFVVICDCTGRNPNVFYELGIAHTLGRDVVVITQSESDIPFDIRHLRYVHYTDNEKGLEQLREQIVERLDSLI